MTEILTLSGLSQKGKHRVKRDGGKWRVRHDLMENHATPPKGKLLVQSVIHPNEMRWIKEWNDPDFDVESVSIKFN